MWIRSPGWKRSPEGGNGNPLQYSCLGNPTDRGASRATVHGVAELDRTQQLSRQQKHSEGLMYIGGQKFMTTHLQFPLFSWEGPVWKELWFSLSKPPLCSRGEEEEGAQACVGPDLVGFLFQSSWGTLPLQDAVDMLRDGFSALQQSQPNSKGRGRSQMMFSGQSPNFIHNNVDLTVISDFCVYFWLAQNQWGKCYQQLTT